MSTDVPAVSRRSSLITILRFVHDRNPFYLLSALCMFVGFRIILGALNSAPGDWKTLLGLIVTLNFYEVVMIGLALFLIVKRGLIRDGWILLGIEALFLLDLTNLNAELFTAMPRLGAAVNSICFLLAMAKILMIIRTLGLRLTPGTAFYIAAQFAFLFAMPGIFRLMRSTDAAVSAMQIYSIWWMAGLLIAAGAFLVKRLPQIDDSPMAPLPFRLYIVLPLISLLVHLCSENRVYWVHFHYANVAPVLLGFVVVLSRSKWRWHRMALQWSLGLVAASILISILPPNYQHELSGKLLGLTVSPLRLMLIGSSLMTFWLAIDHRSLIATTIAAGCMTLSALGTNVMEIDLQALNILRWMYHVARRLIPETAGQWGIVAIGSAFVLLGIGAVVSLKAAPPSPLQQEPVAS
jgi:hypothetical protein